MTHKYQNALKQLVFVSLFAVLGLLSLQFSLTPNASAALFENAKSDACAGAELKAAPGCNGADATKADDIIKRVVNILSVIVGIIAVIMVLVGGLKFVTSRGDSNAVSSARSTIIYALVGLVIVAVAQILVKYVIKTAGG